ncbi:LysR family transcriptional regulator [Enterococcus sp. JM4C]|uniref:LysR family transcriptional regulator n=1 Tax=Candidatus Enterococcus huntleyi TaxID=1857217 RepID=UPI00137AC8AC|nr:LysR family transcriptional regulator [Enterococcus sp. JM4C]KAF1298473.1 LysR family transcriptional regulator [Enterococcus sp. JM4C]
MNFRHLEYFIKLAENEHMRLTAEQLNTSQPNLSHAISVLEKELGVALFEKKGRNIYLTSYGKLFYEYVSPGLNKLYSGKQMLQELASPETGQIQLGFIYTMGSVLTPTLAKQFLAVPGNEQIHFRFSQGNSCDMLQQLKSDTLDIAICSKIDDDPEVQFDSLTEQKIVVVVPENHPLSSKKSVSLDELAAYPFVYYNQQSGLRPYIDEILHAKNIQPTIACEVEEDHSMLGFVGSDYGVAIMPDIPSISAYPVKKLRIADIIPARHIYLATRKNKKKTPVVQKFYNYCLENKETLRTDTLK